MREIQQALTVGGINLPAGLDVLLAKAVWGKYHEARQQGLMRRRIWFVTVDFSGEIGKLLTRWFGPDPLGRTV